MRWRKFGKLDLKEREAVVWISEKQRIKVSVVDYADEEDTWNPSYRSTICSKNNLSGLVS